MHPQARRRGGSGAGGQNGGEAQQWKPLRILSQESG